MFTVNVGDVVISLIVPVLTAAVVNCFIHHLFLNRSWIYLNFSRHVAIEAFIDHGSSSISTPLPVIDPESGAPPESLNGEADKAKVDLPR
jgi:hypothetical protein